MSRVIEIRQSVDGVLDRWQVKVEAMETLLDASQDQVLDKLEASKQAYVDVIDKVKVGIADSQSLAQAEKDRLQQRLGPALLMELRGGSQVRLALERRLRHGPLQSIKVNRNRRTIL